MLRIAFLLATLAALGSFSLAYADGEVGLVIHWGDGRTDTQCIAFEGDSITGDELLIRAGYDINQFSGLVCAINDVGCQHSGSFDSCTCECKSGGDCTYWGFFLQPYDDTWFYSALGAFSARSEDGDLQGWQWGEGGPASAPVPPATTFEAVCGHPPGAASTVPPTATNPPAAIQSQSPETTAPTAPPNSNSTEGATTAPAAGPSPIATVSGGQATIPLATPGVPVPGQADTGESRGVLAFAVVAAGLVAATAAALAWRSRRGP